jgi:beta-glucanase (GH16 family)
MPQSDAAARLRQFHALTLALVVSGCGGGGSSASSAPAAPVSAPAPASTPSTSAVSSPVAAPPAAAPIHPAYVPASYRLTWADEFDVDGLPDATRWAYDTERNRLGWFNNELQYYGAGRPENAVVSGGRLRLTARLESLGSATDWGGQRYTSARLITRGKAAWTYGYFEVRAKLPCGRGTWPAIWTLGSGGVWPDDGEIDLMEQVGSNPARVFGTVHTRASGGVGTGAAVQLGDACTAFHDYQLHWTADEIALGVDGVTYYRYANPRAGGTTWPFAAPQYLLLNIAIGGTLGGAVDDTIFPVSMEIEHVRVWQAVP